MIGGDARNPRESPMRIIIAGLCISFFFLAGCLSDGCGSSTSAEPSAAPSAAATPEQVVERMEALCLEHAEFVVDMSAKECAEGLLRSPLDRCPAAMEMLECMEAMESGDEFEACLTRCDEMRAEAKKRWGQKLPGLFFATDKPQLVGPLEGLEFGANRLETFSVNPNLAFFVGSFQDLGDDEAMIRPNFFRSNNAYLDYLREPPLDSVTILLPRTGVLEGLTEAWGEPKRIELSGQTTSFWHNRQAKLRAAVWVDSRENPEHIFIKISPYQIVSAIVGTADSPHMGFEPEGGLLGKTAEQVRAHYENRFLGYTDSSSTESAILLGAEEFGLNPQFIEPTFVDGVVKNWQFDLRYSAETERDQVLEILAGRYDISLEDAQAAAQKGLPPDQNVWKLSDSPYVHVRNLPTSRVLRIEVIDR